MAYPIGRTFFALSAVMVRDRWNASSGTVGSGEELLSKRSCRIASYLNDLDPEDESDWPRQHQWLAERLNDFHRVFSQRVRALDLETQPDEI